MGNMLQTIRATLATANQEHGSFVDMGEVVLWREKSGFQKGCRQS